MLLVDILNTGGIGLEQPPILKVSDLVEVFCVYPEIYKEQHQDINILSHMFDLFRDPSHKLIEDKYGEIPLFCALEAYYSLIVLEQLKRGECVCVGLDFNLPSYSFRIEEGSEVKFTQAPKTLLNAKGLDKFPYWIYFFNTMERCKNEIRNKYRNTNS